MRKVMAAAIREYKTTALTKAFLLGAVIFPMVIWAAIIGITASGILESEKDPLKGTVGVIDATSGAIITDNLRERFDKERLAEEMARELQSHKDLIENNPLVKAFVGDDEERKELVWKIALEKAQERIPEVDFESIDTGTNLEAARKRVTKDDLIALLIVGENSIAMPTEAPTAPESESDPGRYTFLHAEDLDPEYVKQVRNGVASSIQEERYRREGIDPAQVRAIDRNPPRSFTRSIDESGAEQVSSENFTQMLPFIFMMLLFTATITGGQYLLMGTLEEKGSRVMEVLLSAVSPLQLLIGKLLGQGAVGLTILGIYSALGVALADRFSVLSLVPVEQIPWLIVYFIMAYAYLGSLMVAVGAAVTEIREAQALYAPITISMILPFILMVPIMQNPTSIVARVFSFFPPTTPFVMVMRLSSPAHPVPLWELALSIVVGFAGVAVAVWIAAKIFRVGVLMYGKPPSLLTLVKWVRYA